ncbi:uncharacterized protein si:dkey-28a3.2 isoform X2 [Oreochromis aureus]|uniref:uncharacterized protein si:dkey-28a3.2 isoform X2 n=1 Tax=Oreochromis aureus TaxID=47969 RepID=UPI0019537F9D|nr:uncharacterized protein si:dkey-28a3.2 isoform X2 [Oreochromis aureus]
MPTAKGKGGSTSHRYRPASEYDDATLALKREYWRNKKREQRARLSEERERHKHNNSSRGGKQLNAPAEENSTLAQSSGALSSPLQSNDNSYNSVSKHRNALGDGSCETTESQKEKWLQTVKLNKRLPQLPVSCSISARSASGSTAAGKRQTARDAAVSLPVSSGTQLNTVSSVPPVRVTRITNGSSSKTAPQPCVSMQGASVPRNQHKAQVVLPTQPKVLPTGLVLVSSPCGPTSTKAESKTAISPPQSGTKRALVTTQRAKGVGNAQASLESDEERAAKRREQWRLKKREQRAKLAARLAKARERAQGAEMTFQRLTAPKTGHVGSIVLPSESLLRGASQKQCHTRVKTPFTSAKSENNKLQSGTATVVVSALQTSDTPSVKKPVDSQGKVPSYGHLCGVTRGIARYKTPRQRFIEAQRNLMNHRSLRCKSPMLPSAFGTRSMPKINPDDTPEQIIAKRREYWRIKKREQRAKLSMEVKVRLKERDSLMRRVKRYQKILEEMRKTRVLAQSTGSALTHSPETIGGFIKEDGTLTANIPHSSVDHSTAEDKSQVELCVVSTNTPLAQPQCPPDAKLSSAAPIRINTAPPPLCLAQVKVSAPGQPANKLPRLLAVRPQTQHESTSVPNLHSSTIQTVGQLTLTHPQSPQNSAGSNVSSCVMKMTISSRAPSLSALSLDAGLTEEERMAKKREYWRIKKREQRAARAVRLRQGVLHARAGAALQRRKPQKQGTLITVPQSRNLTDTTANAPPLSNNSVLFLPHANEMKQESDSMPAADLNSPVEQAICPDIKPPTSPPPAPQLESDPCLSADSQTATLLAVASMKKLLEESLSTVTECKSEQNSIKMETIEEVSQQDMKPNLSQLSFERDDTAPIAADLTLQIKSWELDSKVSAKASLQSPQLKNPSQVSETAPPLPASSEVGVHRTSEHSSQTPVNYMVNTSMEAPRRTQRLCAKKAGYKTCCSPEPPKLHHITAVTLDNLQPQQQQQEQHQAQEQNNCPEPPRRYNSVVTEQSGLTSLQRKREYWKLMKRQQRAKLKARQKDGEGECSSGLFPRSIQTPGLVIINSLKGSPTHKKQSSIQLAPVSTMVPPKPIPGESEQDFLRRKREYWRIKKKEQRARKAVRDKGITQSFNSWKTRLPPLDLQTEEPGQWVNSSEESEHLMSSSVDSASFTYSDYTAPIEDESELLFAESEEDSVSDAVWRSRYLMDYDPLNQLLVCMVCGELQYSHSLEGVKAHIDEAHPHTLTLEPGEKEQIREAWDEQVSRRERFFSSQLQQHSRPVAEPHKN